ncbi:MAG: DNA-3-methyladenine glycosylase 2 family protein [Actinobacteria bacterium]|nr:DNA-3-methyladenine glycosylase 2 family protein [Actinomycetota bacterium]
MAFMRPDAAVDIRTTLSLYRFGYHDATTQLGETDFWRATLTPVGPGTVHIWWSPGQLDAQAWGDGADWLLERVRGLTGGHDEGFSCPDDAHPAIRAAHRNHPGLRIGSSGALYHELLPAILGQRVTAGEAIAQWRRLCTTLGGDAPGPNHDLRLPPDPVELSNRPAWWFHPLGIEAKRAEALRTVGRYAQRISEWCDLSAFDASAKLHLLRGIGPWTIGSAVGPALGDPDAIPIGDFHLPNMVSWALAKRARGTDEEMLALLEPLTGQRGRVIRLLGMDGHAAPKFGPRQRIQPMYRR